MADRFSTPLLTIHNDRGEGGIHQEHDGEEGVLVVIQRMMSIVADSKVQKSDQGCHEQMDRDPHCRQRSITPQDEKGAQQ